MSGWKGSTRRARLPRDWPAIVAAVKARDHGMCRADHHAPGCDGEGTDVDHIVPNDDDRMSNLWLLSRPCHDAKTQADNAALRDRLNTSEPPPGIRRTQ